MRTRGSKLAVFLSVVSLFIAILCAEDQKTKGEDKAGTQASQSALLVVNQFEHAVVAVSPISKLETARYVVGVNSHEAATAPDGRYAYVPIYGNSGVGLPGTDGRMIDILDLAGRNVVGSIDLGNPVRPHCALFGPDGLLYVTAELANAVYVVDVNQRKKVGEIPTGQIESHMMVMSRDGKRIYTANVGAGSVSVLDGENRKLITVIPVSKRVQRISMSEDGRWVFTQDQTSPRLAVIDTSTNAIARWVDLPEVAKASAATRDGKWLLMISVDTAAKMSHLRVLDIGSLKTANSFDLLEGAMEILLTPDGTKAYISCVQAGKIAVVDLKSWNVENQIVLTPGGDGMAWWAGK
jgi:YVTN family beta-propeller protein